MHIKKLKLLKLFRVVLTLSISISTLIACSNGGGAGTTPGNYQTPVAAGTWQPFAKTGVSNPVMEIYAQDLNDDGIDEVIIAGRLTQPVTFTDWKNFNVQIFGWNTGPFANETSTWMPIGINEIIGTDQAVKFADFDGDGRTDIIMSASTDDSSRSIYGRLVVYHQNAPGVFSKTLLDGMTYWQHDLLVYDFNGDTLSDFLATDYGANTVLGFGKADATFTLHTVGNANRSASGISIANYITASTALEIIMSDSGATIDSRVDTKLFSWSVVDPAVAGTLTLTELQTLPPSPSATLDHGIRNTAMDFDNDTIVDVIVFQRPLNTNTSSAVQFLQNDGAGTFTDVSATTLVNYNATNAGVNYQPVLADFNGDGRMDIFLSGGDSSLPYQQTQVLVQSNDAPPKFVSSYVDVFTSFTNTIIDMSTSSSPTGLSAQIAKGPANEYYIIGNTFLDNGVTSKITTYSAKIGEKPTLATQSASELANNVWPYVQKLVQ